MMNRVVLIMGVTLIYIAMQFYAAGREVESATRNKLKFALNYAAHDAAMQVDPEELSHGRIVFLQDQALQAFKETLSENLLLNGSDLTPLPNSFIRDRVEIVYQEFIDDNSGVTFPFNYINEEMRIFQMIEGPAVVYKIRVPNPKVSNLSLDGYIYAHTIQEYPFP